MKPEKNNSSRGNKNKNPITEAWAEAWKKQTNGKAYPWSGSFHRAVAMARDVDPQPHELLVEDMGRYLRTARELSLEGWIRATVQAQRRAALGRQHETVDDLLGLLPPVEFSPPPTPPPTPTPTPAPTAARRLSAKEEIELAREAQRAKAFGGAR